MLKPSLTCTLVPQVAFARARREAYRYMQGYRCRLCAFILAEVRQRRASSLLAHVFEMYFSRNHVLARRKGYILLALTLRASQSQPYQTEVFRLCLGLGLG